MNLFKFIKEKSKKVLSVAFIAAILASAIIPATAKADGPRFNFMANDPKTLRGSNRTAGDAGWNNTVSGNVGDEFRAIAYIHNGMVDTTARNTRVKVTLPASTTSNKFSVGVSISADNAATVTDTLNVTLNDNANIQFIPGTVAWYPTINSNATNQVAFPNGQTGDEIVTPTGVNVGNVNGCWEYVQYISFGFRAVPQGSFNLNIDKLVKNVTLNETAFVDSNKAHAGDILEYKVTYKNIGNAIAPAAIMVDTIPANTSYIAGTTRLSKNGGAEVNPGDSLVVDGIALGDLAPGETGIVRFRVRTSNSLANGQILVNTAFISSSKITLSDTARTTIISGTIVPPTPGTPLPVTGAGTVIVSTILSLMAGAGYMLYRKAKIASTVESKIVNQLLG